MVLSAREIESLGIIAENFIPTTNVRGKSAGLSVCGYDVRSLALHSVSPEGVLVVTMEKLCMPRNVVGIVHPKSSWARAGVLTPPSVIEPGWTGYPTLLLYSLDNTFWVNPGDPIAQIVFHYVTEETAGYTGKYQDAAQIPQGPLDGQ